MLTAPVNILCKKQIVALAKFVELVLVLNEENLDLIVNNNLLKAKAEVFYWL